MILLWAMIQTINGCIQSGLVCQISIKPKKRNYIKSFRDFYELIINIYDNPYFHTHRLHQMLINEKLKNDQ